VLEPPVASNGWDVLANGTSGPPTWGTAANYLLYSYLTDAADRICYTPTGAEVQKMKRIILGGLLGGIAMFMWEGLAHEVLPLGEAGIKGLASEPPVLASIKDHVKEAGFYIFPWMDTTPGLSKDQAMQMTMEKAKTGPAGIMIVAPGGREYNMGLLLGKQCGFDILAMLLAAALVSWAGVLKGYGGRVLFVTLLGLFPTLSVDLPFNNWYGFPDTYTAAQFFEHLVGYMAGGLPLAAVVKPGR
jgi:hypothetical protein